MHPHAAGALMRRARKLLRAGDLTHHQLVLLDCMVWSCRAPGSDRLSASYTRLARLAHQARQTVVDGVRRLEHLGFLAKLRRRVRVAWGGAIASRQATNVYILQPVTEPSPQSALRGLKEKMLRRPELELALGRLEAAVRSREAARPGGGELLPAGG